MKKKKVENTPPIKTKKKGLVSTVQMVEDILVLNIYKDKILKARYCMSTKNYEFAQWSADTGEWGYGKLLSACGYDPYCYSYYDLEKDIAFDSENDKRLIYDNLPVRDCYTTNPIRMIDVLEYRYGREKREHAEERRLERVKSMMDLIPELPEGIEAWIHKQATNSAEFAFWSKEKMRWSCTGCGKYYPEKYLKRTDGEKKIRHNDMVKCPRCKRIIQVKKRTDKQEKIVHFMILQSVNEHHAVARHFDVDIYWSKNTKSIQLNESMRIVLNKLKNNPKYACDIYYNQYSTGGYYGSWDSCDFDNKGNPKNRRTYAGWLYEDGIQEALEDTEYEAWTGLFCQLAAAGKKVHYNRLMATKKHENLIGVVEYLFKGRFHRLLLETTEQISYWSCNYFGTLNLRGKSMEEIFMISDKQKINRIRDIDGGTEILAWMRWSDETGEKISQEALQWCTSNNINKTDIRFIEDRMSIQQIMNYVIKQQRDGYKGKSAKSILSQWADYLSMCKRLKKKTNDELVYRPRELKRRHDEAVGEIHLREAEVKADEYSERFPGAEAVLEEIRNKFEYQNENYIITVPKRLIEIVADGRTLHHCAGGSDRYFDRIMQRETYICFLRKAAEPNVPYYTIEVEPGGTIRQHRGYLDEEPDIEQIKPFLREWQKEIRKKMSQKDHELAEISKVKREANIQELKEKNNTRVLEGLMEDFMEAI